MSDLSLYDRSDLAALYRKQARELTQAADHRNVDTDVIASIDKLCDLLAERADELWPRHETKGTWSLEVLPEHPGIVSIKTTARGSGEARIWLREAGDLSWALKQVAKHEITRETS